MLIHKQNGDWRVVFDLRGLFVVLFVSNLLKSNTGHSLRLTYDYRAFLGRNFFLRSTSCLLFTTCTFGFMAPDGLYRYNAHPQGYVSSMAIFTRLIDLSMIGMGDMTSVHVDDIIVHSKTFSDRMNHVDEVFARLGAAGLKVNLAKFLFLATYSREKVSVWIRKSFSC